jgi:hypothetical protein
MFHVKHFGISARLHCEFEKVSGDESPQSGGRRRPWKAVVRAQFEVPLAAMVMPATVEHIRRISEHGERMPAKSTYFYPKLLGGLVINPLR